MSLELVSGAPGLSIYTLIYPARLPTLLQAYAAEKRHSVMGRLACLRVE